MTDNNYEYVGRPRHGTMVGHSDQSAWEKAAPHRAHLLRLLQRRESERQGIIGVFGVGDGTSLDLQGLLKRFHEVHLVDRDATLMSQIIQDQKLDDRHRIIQQPYDISGVHDQLEHYRTDPTDERFAEIFRTINEHTFPDLPCFDVTMSISQIPELTLHASRCIGNDPNKLVPAVAMTRRRHLELLMDHTVSSGMVIMVIDIVSSKTVPPLARSPENLREILYKAYGEGNFFPGAFPASFHEAIEEFKDRFVDGNVTHPWIRQTADEYLASVGWQLLLR